MTAVPHAPETIEDTLRRAREAIDTQASELANLRTELDAAKTSNFNLNTELGQARNHITRIRTGLITEAKERGWCDELNDFLESVGLEPHVVPMVVHFSGEITVQASMGDSDAAIERAIQLLREAPDDYLSFSATDAPATGGTSVF